MWCEEHVFVTPLCGSCIKSIGGSTEVKHFYSHAVLKKSKSKMCPALIKGWQIIWQGMASLFTY